MIRNGTIIDGTGAPPFTGDVAIADDHIVGVGQVRLDPSSWNGVTTAMVVKCGAGFSTSRAIATKRTVPLPWMIQRLARDGR